MKHEFIQNLLDNCLLSDEEMEMGPRKWQEKWYDTVDKIRLPTKLYIDLQDDYDNAVVKVQAMDDFEDIENMTVTEVFEDEEPPASGTKAPAAEDKQQDIQQE